MARRQALGALVAGGALLAAAPSPAQSFATLVGSTALADPLAPVVAVVTLAAQLLVGWLLLVCVVALGARAPGAAGRCLAPLSRVIAPRAVRRAVELALGLSVVLGAVAVPAASASVTVTTATSVTTVAEAPPVVPDLDWAPTAPPAAEPPPTPTPAPPTTPTTVRGSSAPDLADDPVVVRPGDTLWHLAAQSLQATDHAAPSEARIAQAWPQWWAANRSVIGDDPDLLLPGMTLRPPG